MWDKPEIQPVLVPMIVYALIVIAMATVTVHLIRKYRRCTNSLILLLCIILTVSGFGYFLSACATNIESAVFARKVTFIGRCFLPFTLFMTIADISNVKVNKKLGICGAVFSAITFIGACSIGYTYIFYKSVDFEIFEGVPRLIKEEAIMYRMYQANFIGWFLGIYIILISGFFRRNRASFKVSITLLILITIGLAAKVLSSAEILLYDATPLVYAILMLVVFNLMNRLNLYDNSATIADILIKDNDFGYVVFDNKMKFLSADETAKNFFTDLRILFVDRGLDSYDTPFLKDLFQLLCETNLSGKHEKLINSREQIIKLTCVAMRKGDSDEIKGYTVVISDDTQNQKNLAILTQYSTELSKEVSEKARKIRQIQNDIILNMATIVENRDSNTGGHIKRTSECVRVFVEEALSKSEIYSQYSTRYYKSVILAAPLHDFGKIAVRDEILLKQGKFTPEEYEEMKKHPNKGAVIVSDILQSVEDKEFVNIAVNVAHYHHEKWDGNGYPEGLSGEDIPFEARIMALADVFDALVSKRCYKEKYSYEKAFQIISESTGSHFDPQLGKLFIECRPKLEALYDSFDN